MLSRYISTVIIIVHDFHVWNVVKDPVELYQPYVRIQGFAQMARVGCLYGMGDEYAGYLVPEQGVYGVNFFFISFLRLADQHIVACIVQDRLRSADHIAEKLPVDPRNDYAHSLGDAFPEIRSHNIAHVSHVLCLGLYRFLGLLLYKRASVQGSGDGGRRQVQFFSDIRDSSLAHLIISLNPFCE